MHPFRDMVRDLIESIRALSHTLYEFKFGESHAPEYPLKLEAGSSLVVGEGGRSETAGSEPCTSSLDQMIR